MNSEQETTWYVLTMDDLVCIAPTRKEAIRLIRMVTMDGRKRPRLEPMYRNCPTEGAFLYIAQSEDRWNRREYMIVRQDQLARHGAQWVLDAEPTHS